jgi:hypothetical protein
MAVFEKYPTAVQAALLDANEALWEVSEVLEPTNNGSPESPGHLGAGTPRMCPALDAE